jgi:hypothetical protein
VITVSYKRDRLISQAVGCLFLALGGAWLGLQNGFGFTWRALGWLLAIGLPFVSLALARKAIDGQPAIRETARGLELSSLYGSRSVPWKNLTSIEREVLQQSSTFGLIKQDVAHYLVFAGYETGSGEFRFKIQEDLIDWPKAELVKLFEVLTTTWQSKLEIDDQPGLRPIAPGFAASTFGRRPT